MKDTLDSAKESILITVELMEKAAKGEEVLTANSLTSQSVFASALALIAIAERLDKIVEVLTLHQREEKER